jgi:putative endonuclease
MKYSYVLLSDRDGRFYVGSTGDLRQRLREHNACRVHSMAYRRPMRLVYYEACWNLRDARCRERYLKSGRGGRFLKQRLASWLSVVGSNKLERH